MVKVVISKIMGCQLPKTSSIVDGGYLVEVGTLVFFATIFFNIVEFCGGLGANKHYPKACPSSNFSTIGAKIPKI